jgi:hypothetical protein
MGTKTEPGRFDCYGAAEPHEPIFILLGRDPVAADLVREWVKRRQAKGEGGDKIMEALSCASDMDAFAMEYRNRPRPPVVEMESE